MSCQTCPIACGAQLVAAANQPFGIEVTTVDDVFIKEMTIPDAGTIVPQHAHRYEHTSLVARGAVDAWRDGEYLGVFTAPATLHIPAGAKHTFQSRVDSTTLYCIHNVSRAKTIEVAEEHHIIGDPPCLGQ